MFREYFGYQNPSFLTKDSSEANQVKNEQMVNLLNDILNDLRNAVDKMEITKNENPDKGIDIDEKILDFNKHKKDKGLKILNPKQMLQRLIIAYAQVKAYNTSENILNEIHQRIYSLHQAKEVTKKVYNNEYIT